MKDLDDLDLKAEIDEIAKKIDTIIQQVDHLDPTRQDAPDQEQT